LGALSAHLDVTKDFDLPVEMVSWKSSSVAGLQLTMDTMAGSSTTSQRTAVALAPNRRIGFISPNLFLKRMMYAF
jgi:hypothetical protein